MYKLYSVDPLTNEPRNMVIRVADHTHIPMVEDNTDYQTFKKDLSEGASLKDAEGNDMTAEQVTAFLGELK